MINLAQIENIEKRLQEFTLEGVQSGDVLCQYGIELSAHLSWSGEQVSIAKRLWREAQAKAYETYILSRLASGMDVKPQMAKDYVAAKCGAEEANYERVERCHKSVSHTMDFLRSVMATLRTELQSVNNQPLFNR